MKEIFKIFQFSLLMCGVFCADEDEEKSVSVMEGDSVTLHADVTQIQGINLILWRFGSQGSTIAGIDGDEISYEDEEIFSDRLHLDQNGALTIMNMKTKHSGRYKAEISHSTGKLLTKFIVTVYESPSVIDAVKGEMKIVSVTEGESVTLQTDVTELRGKELIVWRFGEEGKLIAKHDIEAKSPTLYNTDERFRDRLQLDHQTGSLIITNSRTADSGLYKVKISSNKPTLYKRFTVTVSEPGSSPGAVAGIVVVVVLLVSAAAAAAAVGVFYYHHKITNLPSQKWSVPTGDDVTLNPDTEIQTGDEIQWRFGAEDTLIAEIKKETGEMTTHDGPDEIFKNSLELNKTTGSLTITFFEIQHTGLYTLKIRRGRKALNKRFQVSVKDWRSVNEGDDVTLYPGIIMQTNDEIQWVFDYKEQQTVIAEIKTGEINKYNGPDWRFRDRLELDKETYSLTITKFTAAHTGYYTLKIRRGRETLYDRFLFCLEDKKIEVMKGESVILESGTKINKDDLILWLFGDAVAMFKRETGKVFTYDHVAGGIFKDRLELDETTGSLTIRNTRTAHSGLYKLQIISSSGVLDQTFIVTVKDKVEEILVNEGESVTLNPHTEIQRGDQIQWMFADEDNRIAQIKGGTGETYNGANERFKDRLKLDKTTGSLTMTNISDEHTGLYKLQIISSSSGKILYKKFKVSIQYEVEKKLVNEGESVTLNPPENTEIQEDDLVLCMFGYKNRLIAQIKGGTVETYDGAKDKFKDRLKLDKTTGSLTITNISSEHTGLYKLQIISSRGTFYKKFKVLIQYQVEEKLVKEGDSVTLNPHTEIQEDDLVKWMSEGENIAQIKGGSGETYDDANERFKGRLKLNTTGSLTITNISAEHIGLYKLQIISSSRGTLNKKFYISIQYSTETQVNESTVVDVLLLGGEDLDGVNDQEGMSLL